MENEDTRKHRHDDGQIVKGAHLKRFNLGQRVV